MRKFCSLVFLFFACQCLAGWEECKPLRAKNPQLSGAVQDVECHLNAGHPYASSDLGHFSHEGTHGINSLIRNQHPGCNGFYTLSDRCMVLVEPKITLGMVSDAVPADQRGGIYSLYMQQMRGHWDDHPLYVLDELTAYLNGCHGYLQQHGRGLDFEYSKKCAWEMLGYARVLVEVVKKRDPTYSDMVDLVSYLDYCKLRLETL